MDGVLFSCDFTSKSSQPTTTNQEVILTLDDHLSVGNGRKALQAKARLESARKSLKDKQEAKKALEAALRLSAPVKDDFSLAEEMSKCEGLMTRTGLKRVAATDSNSMPPNSGANSNNLSGKAKSSLNSLKKDKGNAKKLSPARNPPPQIKAVTTNKIDTRHILDTKKDSKDEALSQKKETGAENVSHSLTTSDSKSVKEDAMEVVVGGLRVDGESSCPSVPCGCPRNPSSAMVGSEGSTETGWEGTASLCHGSRLRFGCLQFIVSLAGHPGHSEMLQALVDQGTSHQLV